MTTSTPSKSTRGKAPAASADESPATPVAEEAFIPISKFALLERLTHDKDWEGDPSYCSRFFFYLVAWRHQVFREKLNELKKAYLPFSPDRDTVKVLQYSPEELSASQDQLLDEVANLVLRANYNHLTREDMERVFTGQSPHGLELKVDLSEYEQLLLFYRGSGFETTQKRTWQSLFMKQVNVDVPIYQRLFLLIKLKPEDQRIKEIMESEGVDEEKAAKKLRKYRSNLPERMGNEHIYLKLFKRIPQVDLEMLFPTTRIALKPFDKLKLGVTCGGGTGASIIATATKVAAAANPMTAATALGGLAAVIFRQVTKVISQRTKYMMLLAQKLYFHNLANNRGVLTLLVDRAEEEEVKEALLVYYFLARGIYKRNQLDLLGAEIEAFLEREYGIHIQFDVGEAVSRLVLDGIVTEQGEDLVTLPPDEACKHLESRWLSCLSEVEMSGVDDEEL